jgi:hypothetical protein
MFRRKSVVQNRVVAGYMRTFFGWTRGISRSTDPKTAAEEYGRLHWELWHEDTSGGRDEVEKIGRSRFNIGLSINDPGSSSFVDITKRATLVSDTLLLSHDRTDTFHDLGQVHYKTPGASQVTVMPTGDFAVNAEHLRYGKAFKIPAYPTSSTVLFGMHCPDLEMLGQWILDAEPLLRAGLTWYRPNFSLVTHSVRRKRQLQRAKWLTVVDLLIKDGRAVDASGVEPIKSQLIRPILWVDLPFLEGVDMRTFSQITIEEYASFSAFRDFLRQSFLEMDESLNAVQSERELVKLGLQIKDQIRSVRADMKVAQRKRALALSGAVTGSVGAILTAVYGPALAAAVAAIGAGGGVWSMLHAAAEKNPSSIREDTWYYVWVLAKKSNIDCV